jgi:tRNA(Ile)-lysidine synthase
MQPIPAGRYVVAVSGGVDSVVLLDLLSKLGRVQLVVAHFDHGIRPDSSEDAVFVEALAKQHGLPFVTKREELRAGASEELARQRRYVFLREVAKDHEAGLMTAHHADDVIETIAINLSRGTGWRGLAVLDDPSIVRPLINYTKDQIKAYADKYGLQWREDSTNQDEAYLRNALRRRIGERLDADTILQLHALWQTQRELKRLIDEEATGLIGDGPLYSRHLFTMVDEMSASEMLRSACWRQVQTVPTRPQRQRALLAIKTARAGTICSLGEGASLVFTQAGFTIEKL